MRLGNRLLSALAGGLVPVGLLGLGLDPALPARAATGPSGATLSISPAINISTAGRAGELPSITVANATKVRFQIRIYPALVDQLYDGGLAIRERPGELKAARRRFRLNPPALLLGPGERATVQARVLKPVPRGEAVGAAVIEAIPATPAGRLPPYRLRLLGALLVPGTAAPAARGRISSLRIAQVSPRRLRFLIRVSNYGAVHGFPSALRLRVRDHKGRIVFSAAPQTGLVLPGYARDVRIDTLKRLAPGRYRAEASGLFETIRSRRVARFIVDGKQRVASR